MKDIEQRIDDALDELVHAVGSQVTKDYEQKNGIWEGMSPRNEISRQHTKALLLNIVNEARIDVVQKSYVQLNIESGKHEVWFKAFNPNGQKIAGTKKAYISELKAMKKEV